MRSAIAVQSSSTAIENLAFAPDQESRPGWQPQCRRAGVHFDLRLWRMTVGLRWRIALGVLLGLLALAIGIARFAFLGQFLARLFRSALAAELVTPLAATLVAILLRAWLDDARTMLAHRTAARVQETL